MKVSALKYNVLTWVSGLTMLILLLMPFHALLTVWGSSIFGHYTAFRLWKEALLVISIFGASYLLLIDHKIRSHTLSRRLVWVILAYFALNVVWGCLAVNQHDSTAKAVGYGLIINLRFLAFFLVAWAVTIRTAKLRKNWQWLVLWPAGGVVIFGLLQVFVLPNDFLGHFGYGSSTIPIYETINNNVHYLRFASTLRGANPLGAYLIIPISLLVVLLLKPKANWRQALLLSGCGLMLFFSFSRSAWIGAVLTLIVILVHSLRTKQAKLYAAAITAVVVLIIGGISLAFHDNTRFQNFVFHTQDNSAVKSTSNDGHLDALKNGINDAKREPLGQGVGTAGPASVYNNKPPKIAENYFVQIAQETGVIGLVLFILINIGVGYLLWLRRADTLAFSLFASLIGLTFINLLSHAWTDDTLAYVWWGLAGIAMAPLVRISDETQG